MAILITSRSGRHSCTLVPDYYHCHEDILERGRRKQAIIGGNGVKLKRQYIVFLTTQCSYVLDDSIIASRQADDISMEAV